MKKKILIVSNDAGGAEVISAYMKANLKKRRFFCLATGPAEKIFTRKGLKKYFLKNGDPAEILKKIAPELVLVGNSWGSSLQLEFIRSAKQAGIESVIYVDHWADFRKSLGYPRRNWKENIPDQFWAGDKYQLQILKKLFPSKKLRFVANLYFQEKKAEYQKIKAKIKIPGKNILFMSEPILAQSNCFGDKPIYKFSEYEVLENLLEYFYGRQIKSKIVICYHPAESSAKYDQIIKGYKGKLNLEKQKGEILKTIANSSLVIGMMSMILVIAVLCKKKTVSFIPDKKAKCPLPFKQVIKINELAKLKL